MRADFLITETETETRIPEPASVVASRLESKLDRTFKNQSI